MRQYWNTGINLPPLGAAAAFSHSSPRCALKAPTLQPERPPARYGDGNKSSSVMSTLTGVCAFSRFPRQLSSRLLRLMPSVFLITNVTPPPSIQKSMRNELFLSFRTRPDFPWNCYCFRSPPIHLLSRLPPPPRNR